VLEVPDLEVGQPGGLVGDEARLVGRVGRVAFEVHAAVVGADAVDQRGVLLVVGVVVEHHHLQRRVAVVGDGPALGLQHGVGIALLGSQLAAGVAELRGGERLGTHAQCGAAGLRELQHRVGQRGLVVAGAVAGAVGAVVVADGLGRGGPQGDAVVARPAVGQGVADLLADRGQQGRVLAVAQRLAQGVVELVVVGRAEQGGAVAAHEAVERLGIARIVLQRGRGAVAPVHVVHDRQRAGEAGGRGALGQGLHGVGLRRRVREARDQAAHAGHVVQLVVLVRDQRHHLTGRRVAGGVGAHQPAAVKQATDGVARDVAHGGRRHRAVAAAGDVVGGAQIERQVDEADAGGVVAAGLLSEALGHRRDIAGAEHAGRLRAAHAEQAVVAVESRQVGDVVGQGAALQAGQHVHVLAGPRGGQRRHAPGDGLGGIARRRQQPVLRLLGGRRQGAALAGARRLLGGMVVGQGQRGQRAQRQARGQAVQGLHGCLLCGRRRR